VIFRVIAFYHILQINLYDHKISQIIRLKMKLCWQTSTIKLKTNLADT